MPFSLSTLPSSLQSHQMSLLRAVVVVFATLSLFAGFAAALPGKEDHPDYPDDHHPKIWGPKCYDDKWKWVCILSFLSFIPWPLSDLSAFVFRRTILSVNTRARSQRTCCRHATVVVSCLFYFVLRLRDLSSHPFRSVFYPTAWPEEEIRSSLQGRHMLVQPRHIFPH